MIKKILFLFIIFTPLSVFADNISEIDKEITNGSLQNNNLMSSLDTSSGKIEEKSLLETLPDEQIPLALDYYFLELDEFPSMSYDAGFESFMNSKIIVKKNDKLLEEDILKNLQSPIEYKVQKGDTLESIGKRANIDPRYIIESNIGIIYGKVDKSSENFVEIGQTIIIPNKTGIAYKVKKGDSKESIMKEFNFGIKTWNEYNSSGKLKEGDLIVFPISNERLKKQKNLVSFYWGYCTWYVGNKLMGQINWKGNANNWIENAKKAGNKVDKTPKVNSIIVLGGKGMPYGHVGLVEEVKENTIIISEMNWKGLGIVSRRVLEKDNSFIKGYIHTLKNSLE